MPWLNIGQVKSVKLSCSAVLRLGEPNPGPQEAEEGGCAKDKPYFAAQIARVGVEHVRENKTDEPLHNAKNKVRQSLRTRPQAQGRDLSCHGPSDGTESDLVNEAL